MNNDYRNELRARITAVYTANPTIQDHHTTYPWLTGALGDPESRVWFVGENPSLGQVERVTDPRGGLATEEAQWWASRGDRLFREMLVKHGFKDPPIDSHGGWHCYITNVIKEADYAEVWRGTKTERQRAAAQAWLPVFRWELDSSRPLLLAALGKTVRAALSHLEQRGLQFPRIETIQHYSYVALRPRGNQGPMHPERIREYDQEFASVAKLFRALKDAA